MNYFVFVIFLGIFIQLFYASVYSFTNSWLLYKIEEDEFSAIGTISLMNNNKYYQLCLMNLQKKTLIKLCEKLGYDNFEAFGMKVDSVSDCLALNTTVSDCCEL